MVTFADEDAAPNAADDVPREDRSVADIVRSHFDAHQRDPQNRSRGGDDAGRAASALRSDLLSVSSNGANVEDGDGNEEDGGGRNDGKERIAEAALRCVDSAFSLVATAPKKDAWGESVAATIELAAAFACLSVRDDGGLLAGMVVDRAAEFGAVENDAVRGEACRLLGLCAKGLAEGGRPAASILKRRGKRGSRNARREGEEEPEGGAARAAPEGWKIECLLTVAKALLPRVTDKVAKVRGSAIAAVVPLLSPDASGLRTASDEFAEATDALRWVLLWIASNDASAGNRASATRALPSREEEDEDVVAALVERIKDVDGKVRAAALDNLRENVEFEGRLDEDARAEVLRAGLTKRCPTTYAKTVELLCCNWLKSCKFDPIALLDKINPVLNENVCEQAAQILLRVASAIDDESSTEKGVQLVQKHFSAPEIRSLQQQVFMKRNLPTPPQGSDNGDDEEEVKLEQPEPPSLSPSTALFLRVKIDSATSNKAELISEIIVDIPTLCNLLNAHIDALISFHESDEYDEMDEDAIAAYEDDKNFLSLQLIHMAKSSEVLSEEGSRRHFLSIMRRILSRLATPDDLVDACVKAMAVAHDKEAHFLQTISEVLADVEDDDSFRSDVHDEKAIVIVRQMRIIAILSIVLENLSGQMVDHPILDGFLEHLSPAITSKNAIVREHGVICLSKFCLLSSAEKVTAEFEPLLRTIAGSKDERVEVRAQAALALCDLALIHDGMLLESAEGEGEDEEKEAEGPTSVPFKDMLLEMLDHPKPGIVIIAAEIAAKLLLAGRLRDPALVAHLLVVYFDRTLVSSAEEDDVYDEGADAAGKVGSPVRLQQLLSIFFPTYAMSSLEANDDLIASVGPLLSIVNRKLLEMRRRPEMGKAMLAEKWPIAKMVQYVCYTVDLADKKNNEQAELKKEVKVDDAGEMAGKIPDDDVDNNTDGADRPDEANEDQGDGDAAVVEEDEDLVEASSTLLASTKIARFLAGEGDGDDDAPTFYVRALAKILGSASIDVDAEDPALLRRLKASVAEAEYAHDDGPTVRSVQKLAKLLVDVEDEPDEESVASVSDDGSDDAEGEAAEEDDPFDFEAKEDVGKENPRSSVGSVKSTSSKQTEGAGDDVRRASGHRASLADVSCN